MRLCVPSTMQHSGMQQMWTAWPTMGFGSSTIHQEQPQVRRVRGLRPMRLAPFQMPLTSPLTCASDPWGQIGDFHDPFLGCD